MTSDFSKFTWQKDVLPHKHTLSAGQLRVLDSIYNHSDRTGKNSHPGQELIATEATLSVKQVGRNLKTLAEAGFIERVKKGNRKLRLNDVYELRLPAQKGHLIKDSQMSFMGDQGTSLIKDISHTHKGHLDVPPSDPDNRSCKGSVREETDEEDIPDVLPVSDPCAKQNISDVPPRFVPTPIASHRLSSGVRDTLTGEGRTSPGITGVNPPSDADASSDPRSRSTEGTALVSIDPFAPQHDPFAPDAAFEAALEKHLSESPREPQDTPKPKPYDGTAAVFVSWEEFSARPDPFAGPVPVYWNGH